MKNLLKNLPRNRRVLIPVLAGVVILAGYFTMRGLAAGDGGALKASGTIETTTVSVSPEEAGKVEAVKVEEGDAVQAGEELFRLDDTLLRAQQAAGQAQLAAAQSAGQTAQAGLAAAQAGYDSQLTASRLAARPTRLKDWQGRTPDYFDQPKWYFTQAEQISALEGEVKAAQAGLAAAQAQVDQVVGDMNNAEFVAAEQRLVNAREAYLVALQVQQEGQSVGQGTSPSELTDYLDSHHIVIPSEANGYRLRIQLSKTLPNQAPLYDASQRAHDAAGSELSAAQAAYNKLLTSASAQRVLQVRAELAVAQERYEVAQDKLSALQTGELSPAVEAAGANLEQARTAAQSAQEAVKQAQANVDLLQAQMAKLVVRAPLAGVVLVRNIEPGEYVAPGAEALSLGDIRDLTITVYVPEDRYGQIRLGQKAEVSVDSFPGQRFSAQVSFISDQAEFTPRNVQTVEGRSSTVYAVKLTVTDPQGRLKPGMPADVTFQ
jgi:membrane fusion protein YbhG